MRKWISLVLVLAMLCYAATVSSKAEETTAVKTRHQIEEKTLTVYLGSLEANFDLPFYFMDGVDDLPWMDMETWCGTMIGLAQAWYGDEAYDMVYSIEGETITLTRENGFSMMFDFAANSIFCYDAICFSMIPRIPPHWIFYP